MGGGTLLLLWLTLAQDMGQLQAGGVNLLYLYAAPCPPCGATFAGAGGKTGGAGVRAGGAAACAAGAFLAAWLDVTLLRRLFGAFLLIVGWRELFFKKSAAKTEGAKRIKAEQRPH